MDLSDFKEWEKRGLPKKVYLNNVGGGDLCHCPCCIEFNKRTGKVKISRGCSYCNGSGIVKSEMWNKWAIDSIRRKFADSHNVNINEKRISETDQKFKECFGRFQWEESKKENG